jgi:deazaflavin-dependent oxidoreductase (nitroreductase family)
VRQRRQEDLVKFPPNSLLACVNGFSGLRAALDRPGGDTHLGESGESVRTLDFHALSLRDLADARDAYHIHLANLTNVVGTALGRYLIRRDDPRFGDPNAPDPGWSKEPRRLDNSGITKWSWPCVLVFVRHWMEDVPDKKDLDQVIPKRLYLPDGRQVPTCVVLTEVFDDLDLKSQLLLGSITNGPGLPLFTNEQQRRRIVIDRSWRIVGPLARGHAAIYRVTGGRLGQHVPGVPPMLLLDHVGAKSGTRRTTPLVYMPDGDRFVVVAAKGGHPTNLAWFYNLRANPYAGVQIGTRRLRCKPARLVPRNAERYGPKRSPIRATGADTPGAFPHHERFRRSPSSPLRCHEFGDCCSDHQHVDECSADAHSRQRRSRPRNGHSRRIHLPGPAAQPSAWGAAGADAPVTGRGCQPRPIPEERDANGPQHIDRACAPAVFVSVYCCPIVAQS